MYNEEMKRCNAKTADNRADLVGSINKCVCDRLLCDVLHLPLVLSSLLQARLRELYYQSQPSSEPILLLCSDYKSFYTQFMHNRTESSAVFTIVLFLIMDYG